MATNARPSTEQAGKPVKPDREHGPAAAGGALPSSFQRDGGKGWAELMAGKAAVPAGREPEPGRDAGKRHSAPEMELVEAIGAYFAQAERMSGISEGRGRDLGISPELAAKERQELGQARQRVEQAIGKVRAHSRAMPEREAEPRVGDDTRAGDMQRIRTKALGQAIQETLRRLSADRDG